MSIYYLLRRGSSIARKKKSLNKKQSNCRIPSQSMGKRLIIRVRCYKPLLRDHQMLPARCRRLELERPIFFASISL